jgi:hypothetical protein
MGVELHIPLEIQISLIISDRKEIADLRTDADNPRLERADVVAASAVAGELVVDIAHRPDEQLTTVW